MKQCLAYLALIGILSFFLGRLIPKRWFVWDRFPYNSFSFEKNGAVYHKLGIRRWQSRIPDMSRILPGIMPAKKLTGDRSEARLERMLRETCVAEWIHALLCLSGFYCLHLWPGPGGIMVSLLFFLGNLPYILVQRYNRPRLAKLLLQSRRRERGVTGV